MDSQLLIFSRRNSNIKLSHNLRWSLGRRVYERSTMVRRWVVSRPLPHSVDPRPVYTAGLARV